MTMTTPGMGANDEVAERQTIAAAANQRESDRLRAAAAVIDGASDRLLGTWTFSINLYYYPYASGGDGAKADLRVWMREMRRRGANIRKEWPANDDAWSSVRVVADFGEGGGPFAGLGSIKVVALVSREQICERVEVGRRTVTEEVPDPEVMKVAERDAPRVSVEHEVVDYEWRCSPILGDD